MKNIKIPLQSSFALLLKRSQWSLNYDYGVFSQNPKNLCRFIGHAERQEFIITLALICGQDH